MKWNFKTFFIKLHLYFFDLASLTYILASVASTNFEVRYLYEKGQNQEKEDQGQIGNVKRNLLKKKSKNFFKIWGCYAMEAEIWGWAIALERRG